MKYAIALLSLLFLPGPAHANSCGTAVVIVNHRDQDITVQMKSFYADNALPAPAPGDFDEAPRGGGIPLHLSSHKQVRVAKGESLGVRFRRLCEGDFWLNWREASADGEIRSSGQLRPYYQQPIHIR